MEKRAGRGAEKNRRSKAGETLAETLIAMLMIGLSSVLFLTMTGAAGRIFRKAEAEYQEIYAEIAAADVRDDGVFITNGKDSIGKITVKGSSSTEITVKWYGDTDYVLSYEVK